MTLWWKGPPSLEWQRCGCCLCFILKSVWVWTPTNANSLWTMCQLQNTGWKIQTQNPKYNKSQGLHEDLGMYHGNDEWCICLNKFTHNLWSCRDQLVCFSIESQILLWGCTNVPESACTHTHSHTCGKDRDKWTEDKWHCGLMQSIILPTLLLLVLAFNMHSILDRALWKAKMKGTLLVWMNDRLLQLSLRNYNGTIINKRASTWRMKSFGEKRCRFFLGFILILNLLLLVHVFSCHQFFFSGKCMQSKHLQKGSKSHQFLRCRHFRPRKYMFH